MSQIEVRVTPRSSRNAVALEGETIKVWVTAPPTDGQANDAVMKLLAKKLGIAPSCLSIVRGEGSRIKTIAVEGIELDEVRRRLT